MNASPLRRTQALGTDFWNDSCSPRELAEAVALGAVGATSNPVIVSAVVKAEKETFLPVLDRLVDEHGRDDEDALAWRLIEELGRRGAALLKPVHERTEGRAGFLSMQVNPKFHRSAEKMAEHGRALAAIAPNIAIKAPCTRAGIEALEALTASGVRVNATVSFSVAQAVAAAEAIERGLARPKSEGAGGARDAAPRPDVTIMVGRLDDHLQRVMAREAPAVEPGFLSWAGIAVFKRAHGIFRERGFRSRLLVAAYRHHLHWSELIGPGVAQTIPYTWWRRFESSGVAPERTLERPVDAKIVDGLRRAFPDFVKAYEPDALEARDFDRFGPSLHTLEQFLGGYQELVAQVRERILRAR